MATSTTIGYSTEFGRWDGTSAYVAIAEVTSVTPPNMARDTPDATHMGSPDGYREFIGGLRDGGEVSIEMNYVPGGTAQTDLRVDFDSDDSQMYEITFPDASTVQFTGFVTALSPSVPLDDKMTFSASFKVTGKPTWA